MRLEIALLHMKNRLQAQLYAVPRSADANEENLPRCVAHAARPARNRNHRPVNGVYVSASVGDVNTSFSCKQLNSLDETRTDEALDDRGKRERQVRERQRPSSLIKVV